MPEQKVLRNWELWALRRDGWTLRQLAMTYGLSVSRISEIVESCQYQFEIAEAVSMGGARRWLASRQAA